MLSTRQTYLFWRKNGDTSKWVKNSRVERKTQTKQNGINNPIVVVSKMQPHIYSFYFHIIYKFNLRTNLKNMINTRMFCHSLEQEPCLGHGIGNFGRAFVIFYYYSITLPARTSLPRKKVEKILKEIHQLTKTFRPLRVKYEWIYDFLSPSRTNVITKFTQDWPIVFERIWKS